MAKLTITLEQMKQNLSPPYYQEVLDCVGDENIKELPLSEVVDILGERSIQCMELVPETEALIKEFTTWMIYDSMEYELDGCSYLEAGLIQEWLENYEPSLENSVDTIIKSKRSVKDTTFWTLLNLSKYSLYSACRGIYLSKRGCEDKLKKILDAGEWV